MTPAQELADRMGWHPGCTHNGRILIRDIEPEEVDKLLAGLKAAEELEAIRSEWATYGLSNNFYRMMGPIADD